MLLRAGREKLLAGAVDLVLLVQVVVAPDASRTGSGYSSAFSTTQVKRRARRSAIRPSADQTPAWYRLRRWVAFPTTSLPDRQPVARILGQDRPRRPAQRCRSTATPASISRLVRPAAQHRGLGAPVGEDRTEAVERSVREEHSLQQQQPTDAASIWRGCSACAMQPRPSPWPASTADAAIGARKYDSPAPHFPTLIASASEMIQYARTVRRLAPAAPRRPPPPASPTTTRWSSRKLR